MSARFTPPPADAQVAPARPQHYTTDPACWRNYVTDLIYAAATSPACYAREVQKRKPKASMAVAERFGADMGRELARAFPDAKGVLGLARAATGEDLGPDDQRARFAATVALCARWLPQEPPTGRQLLAAERERRSGITDEERQANAEAAAAEMAGAP